MICSGEFRYSVSQKVCLGFLHSVTEKSEWTFWPPWHLDKSKWLLELIWHLLSFSKITPSSCHQALAGLLMAHFPCPPSQLGDTAAATWLSSWSWQGSRRLVPFASRASENITCPHFSYGLQWEGKSSVRELGTRMQRWHPSTRQDLKTGLRVTADSGPPA